MKVILSSDKINDCIAALADDIISQLPQGADIAVIGVRSRGEILAKRLSNILSKKLHTDIPFGTLDITLYRDDLNNPQSNSQPHVRSTVINFSIDDKIIILADDVIYTGRTARAAMDAIIDMGRPKAIKLAVLIDRKGRELPIQADFAGETVNIPNDKSVQVNFIESDGKDQVATD